MPRSKVVGLAGSMRRVLTSIGFNRYESNPELIFNCGWDPAKFRQDVRVPDGCRVLNGRLTLNKYEQNRTMANASVPVPDVLRDFRGLSTSDLSRFIIKPYHSHRGIGVRTIEGPHDTIPEGCYVQAKIDKEAEYRAHVAIWMDPPCFSIQKKKPKTRDMEGHVNNAANRLCWNIANGWYMTRLATPENIVEKLSGSRTLTAVADIATRAVQALGHDFGAVDLIRDPNGNYFVLEVNACPGVNTEVSQQIYVDVFSRLLEEPLNGEAVGELETMLDRNEDSQTTEQSRPQPATRQRAHRRSATSRAGNAMEILSRNEELRRRIEEMENRVNIDAVQQENEEMARYLQTLEDIARRM